MQTNVTPHMDHVITEQEEVRPHVLVFIGDTEIRELQGLKTAFKSGETLHILPSVSGG